MDTKTKKTGGPKSFTFDEAISWHERLVRLSRVNCPELTPAEFAELAELVAALLKVPQ